MKKNLTIVMGFVAVFLFACQKNSVKTTTENQDIQINSSSIKTSLSSLPTASLRSQSFKLLTPEEKYNFVKNRIDSAIVDLKLNEIQINAIREVTAYLSPDLYLENSKTQGQLDAMTPAWTERTMKLFKLQDFKYIFASFKTLPEYKSSTVITNTIAKPNVVAPKDCDCSGSAFNDCGNACTSNTSCLSSSFGCGLFFLSTCSNLCN